MKMNPPVLVLSELTLSAIQAEATRAHLKHGDHSMLGPYTDHARLAILAEEAGEAADEARALAESLLTGLRSAQLLAALGRVGHVLTYDQDPDTIRERLEKELIQLTAMGATWIEALNRR